MTTEMHKAPSVAHNTGTSGDNAASVARYDLSTSEGGRRYVADFFARELRRDDFARYITTTLAADFACALAQHLAATGKQQVGEVQGDALHISDEDRAVLQRIQDALPTVGLNGWTKGVEVLERLLRDSLAARQLGWNAEQLDPALGETIDQRDRYHEVADDLASHIERITGVEIGEHSSDNCPWQNAMDAAECYSPAQGTDLHRLVPPEWLSELIGGQMDDLTPGQAWRQGFNQCRDRTLLLVEQAMGFPSGGPHAQGIDVGQQRPLIARALAEWHEDDGNVMWWAWCGRGWAGEAAWCGTPNDSDWPGYHTHWTKHPDQPALIDQRDAAPGVGNG